MALSIKNWGTTEQEQRMTFPCDRYMDVVDEAYYRGVTIHASPDIIFRWLCQIRVAPYSYDWLDNFGRRSPQTLIPGLDQLEVGQDIVLIFEIVDFEKDKYITFRIKKDSVWYKIFGDTLVSYVIVPLGGKECRLLVKLCVKYTKGLMGLLMRTILPLGDRIMMSRQLRNFKRLSEKTQNGL
jgi:hypothetical protein